MRNIYKNLLGIIISALFIYLAFRDINLRVLVNQLIKLPLKPIVLCIAGQLASQVLHWIRWGSVIRRLGRVNWGRIFIIGAIGNAALLILPARSGELVRPSLAARENEIDFGQASATSVIERIVDGLLVIAISFGSLLFLEFEITPRAVYNGGFTFLAIFLGGILILFISLRHQDVIISMLQRSSRWISSHWVERLIDLFESFIQGIRILSTSNIMIPYLGMSLALWGMEFVSIYWLFGILSVKLPFIASFFVITILALGKLIPSGPVQLGVFEFSIAFSLGIFSVKYDEAILFATVFHVIVIILVLGLGLIGLWLNQTRFNSGARE
jgi:uncharacterized protein (TIRG00374 family)